MVDKMSDSIKVAIKVRPLIKREKDENLPVQWAVQGNYIASTDSEIRKRGDGGFHFDHIFDEQTNNKDVFDIIVRPIVDAAVNGFNGTVFAYGQTSSGKTYTMMGALNEPGIIPLAVEYMFDAIASTMRREFLLRVSYLEIYNERVNDLLNKSGIDLKLHEDVNGQIIIKCKEEVTNSPEHVLAIMKKGDKNRRIGETNMNERSSRSHTIFRITIESRESDADSDGAIQVSQLNLVDLAGSERARQTGATGERFKEGRHINMSLSALGLVIMQLSEAQDTQKYVNFRDSKLTRLLQASLGGNAMTAIICAITPAALEESQCTLSFASRAKSVKNKPQINEVMSDATLLKRYAKQIAKLNAELEKMKQENRCAEEMEYKLHEKDQANQLLEERIELLKTKIVSGDNTNIEESFKCRSRRRRTWGGPATFKQNLSIFQPSDILPTIKEMSPEKPCRKSIIQSVDLMNQTFQTAFADFELELIKDERDRENEDDSDEELFITKRKNQNHVKFMDDVCIYKPDYDTYETTPKKKNASCQTAHESQEPPGTPKTVLRERLDYLKQEYDELREYTTLEKQMYIENHQCFTANEEQENIAELGQPIKTFIATKTILAENNDMKEHLQRQSIVLTGGFNNNFDNEELVTDLDIKTQELHEIKGDVIALKLDMTKLQRTIFLLTTENVELSAKLTAEKEQAKESTAHYEKSMDELREEISKLKDEKGDLLNENLMLNEQVKSLESQIINIKENQSCVDCQGRKSKSIATNIELVHTDIEKHEDIKNIDEINSLTDIHEIKTETKECIESDTNLLINFSTLEVEEKTSLEDNNEKNEKTLEVLTVENSLSKTGKKESVESDNNLLINFSTLEVEEKSSSEDNEKNEKTIEVLTMENSLLKTELLQLKDKITVLAEENKRFPKESFQTLTNNIQNSTCDNSLYIASIFNNTFDTEEKIEDEKPDILLHKYISLKEKVDHLLQLNKKLSEVKTIPCAQCAQMKELNESNKVAKLEAKVLTHKLEDMQEKFKRKCADVEVLKNKANEELSLSICETSLDTSLLDGLNVTSVEEEVSHLNKEMQVLKDDHAKLSHLYEEKCSELEKLHNSTVNEADSTSPLKKDTRKNKFRIDKLEKDIDHVKVDLQELKSNVIYDLKRSLNEKASLMNEITMLKSANDELSKLVSQNNLLLETSENNIKSLENTIMNLNTDIDNYKMTQEQMQNEKCNLETEVVNMKDNIMEKEVIIKDLQQIINEYKRDTDDVKEDVFCSENFMKENFDTVGHINKHNLESELKSEIEKLKNDLSTVRNCITKEIRSLDKNLDNEDLLNKSVDDLFFTFLRILLSKESEIIGVLQQQFASDKEKLEDEKKQSIEAENRATLWAKELETEITKLQSDIAKQETERCTLLDKVSYMENLLKEGNDEKQILTKLQNDLAKQETERCALLDKITCMEDLLKKSNHEKQLLTKLQNDVVKQEAERCKLLEKLSRMEDILKESDREKQILIEKMQSEKSDCNDLQKSFNEHSEIKMQEKTITVKDKEIDLQIDMKQEKEEYEQKIHSLTSTLETYKAKNSELMQNVESLEISEKDLKNILNARTDELTQCNVTVEKMKSEIEYLTNACNELNHEIENKNVCINKLTVEIEDLNKSVESYKIKNTELVTKLEGLETNEKNLNVVLNTKVNELKKNSQDIENMKTEMERLVNTFATLNREIENKNEHIAEVTALLQNKSDMLSEHKMRLDTTLLEVELLKKQLEDQKLSTTKCNMELENLKIQNQTELTNVKNALNVESIKYAEVNKQLADLNNKNTSLLAELDTLKEQCSQLEEKKSKLEQKMRNSVSKIKADTQIEDLQEENKTLQSKLEGAYNCIAELKNKRHSLSEEFLSIKKQNESLLDENKKIKDILVDKTEQSNLDALQEQHNALLNEKSKIELVLKEKNMLLQQKEQDLEHYINLYEELKQKNKELDEEAEGLTRENEKLTEKIYSFYDDNDLEAQIKILKEENEKLRNRLTTFDGINKSQTYSQIKTTDTSTNLDGVNTNNDKCIDIKKQIQDLEFELVLRNGRIASLELQIQSENFPYKKKCKDLEENILAFKNKNIQLENEIKRLRHSSNDINKKESYMFKKDYVNTKDQYVQTIPNNRIQFCGTSSGIVDENLRIQKLEKEKSLMKQLCRSRAQRIKELEEKLMELETSKSSTDESNVALKENIFYSTSRSLSK